MKLKKIISGGQTGADRQGLIEAKKRGIPTGGTAPKHFMTEDGNDDSLRDEFGLVEIGYGRGYGDRTLVNAADGDATVWFGRRSPGFYTTRYGCIKAGKRDKFYINPTPAQFKVLCDSYEVINIAGNRLSNHSKVCDMVTAAFEGLDNT